jgi:hypothetical protein
MSDSQKQGRLRVCCTCEFWSYKHKGFCHRLEQGAGKFWMCEDWRPTAAEAEETLPERRETTQADSAPA